MSQTVDFFLVVILAFQASYIVYLIGYDKTVWFKIIKKMVFRFFDDFLPKIHRTRRNYNEKQRNAAISSTLWARIIRENRRKFEKKILS